MSNPKQPPDQPQASAAPILLIPDDTEQVSDQVLRGVQLVGTGQHRKQAHVSQGGASQELREIRQKLGISMMDMATRLGLRYVTYCSYEYGKVRNVNEQVLDRARLELVTDGDRLRDLDMFAGRTMLEIVADWARRMDVPIGNVSAFAHRLGVNKSTVSRWMSGECQPDPQQILRYEGVVERFERVLKRSEDNFKKGRKTT